MSFSVQIWPGIEDLGMVQSDSQFYFYFPIENFNGFYLLALD